MTEKAMVPVKHCQIHLTADSRASAAVAVHPLPHPEVLATGLRELVNMSTIAREAFERKVASNEAAQDRRDKFTGPHFHGIKSVQCSEGTLDVVLEDGTVYLYPLHTVARAKVYVTTHTPE